MRAVLCVAVVLCLAQCCTAVPVKDFVGYPFSNETHQVFHILSASSNFGNYRIPVNTSVPFIIDGRGSTSFTIRPGYVFDTSVGYVYAFGYYPCNDACDSNLINSVYYKEYIQSDQGSASALRQINKIVSSSTEFKQLAECAGAQFSAKWAFEVTWLEVEDDYSPGRFIGSGISDTEDVDSLTFQLVLTTDGVHSFAVMNYAEIGLDEDELSWGSVGVYGSSSNAGYYHQNHLRPAIVNIANETGNTGQLGQWVFRTDFLINGTTITATTTPTTTTAPTDQLLLVPRSGTILGGTPVRVYGPCVQTPKNVKCVFDTKDVEGKYYPDRGQFVCVTPRFEKTGRVQLTLTFTSDDGEEQSHTGIFSVVPDDQFRQVFIQSKVELPLTPTTSINLIWSPDIQPFVDPDSYKVDIAAYILDAKNGELGRGKIVATDLPNSGTATITLKNVYLQKGVVVVPLYIQVTVAGSLGQRGDPQNKASSWSAVTYFTTRTALSFACRQWSFRQRSFDGNQLLDQVEPCPRTVAQAQLPNSNFIQDDVDPFGRHIQEARVFHPGADVCFRQRVPQSGTMAGNYCCYRQGNLCTDSECGGTVDKVTPRDWPTYLQHTMEDVIPAVFCCKGLFPNCNSYQQKRPIDDGSKSPPPPPPPACVYGDPHVVSLDGHKYTFNGKGEYTMIATDDDSFTLQGRMVEAVNREGEKSAATVYSALVGKMADSDTVQIELRPAGLVTFVNGEQIEFEEGTELLEFQNALLQDHGNNTISVFFANGAYFEVKEENDIISVVIVSLPRAFAGKTSGLMGNFNGNTSDDLMPKGGGEPIPLNSSLEVIHEQFGITWIIDDPENSLFSYEEDKSWADYFDPDFTPAYQPTFTDPALEEKAMEICGDDQFCVFDIAATEREEVGMSTMQGNLELEMITELSQPVVCDPQCANGTGVCVANNTCSCAPGYLGDTCAEQDFKPCEVNVCQNGGTCTQSVDLVICDCPEGFAGKQCQTAFTTPRVIPVARTARGYVIRWSISPSVAHRVQHFKITAFQLGSNDLGDDQIADIPVDVVVSRRVRAVHIVSLVEGNQYHMEVSARVGGVYGPPGAVDITY